MENNSIEWKIEGMTCHTCSLNVKKYLEQQGMTQVNVSFATGEAQFQSSSSNNSLPTIAKGLSNLGYHVKSETKKSPSFEFSIEQYLIISSIFTIPLLLHMFVRWHLLHQPIVQLFLCIPVFMIGIIHFGKSGFNSLKMGSPNMDVLIIIGATAAFVYSCIGFSQSNPMDYLFFETCATIITLVLLGNYIEKKSVKQTNTDLEKLLRLEQDKAQLVWYNFETKKEEIKEVSIKEILPNHRVQVNTGNTIPIDGLIISGMAFINESMITGESLPVSKTINEKVIAGTLIENGSIVILVTDVSSNTSLAKIIKLIKSAQADLPPIQKLADKISAWFVPSVISISVITFIISFFIFDISFKQSLLQSIAVLVISCPCAMGLATPTAVVVGLGLASRNGILVKGASQMESLSNITYLLLDKTGTLTNPASHQSLKNITDEVASIIFSLEKNSSHPLAKYLSSYFKNANEIKFKTIEEVKGKGMIGIDNSGTEYKIGNGKWFNSDAQKIIVAKNNNPIFEFEVEEQLKPESKLLIDFCKENNIEPIIISGDNEFKCGKIAAELSIKKWFANMLPEDKLMLIKDYKNKGTTVMIGDGINDGPALAAAHVGVSLGNATSIAKETAGVILLHDNLLKLVTAIKISQLTHRTIKQNLFWAFAYNIIAIPIAALGFLNPMIGALSMAFSDVIVIGNSLRLKIRKIKP